VEEEGEGEGKEVSSIESRPTHPVCEMKSPLDGEGEGRGKGVGREEGTKELRGEAGATRGRRAISAAYSAVTDRIRL
jgi:hypothetical protein